MAGNWGEVVTR